MWRSISATSHITKNSGRRLFSTQNPLSCLSQSQVFHHKSFNSSPCCSHLISRMNPRKFQNQNFRFLSQSSSSISEFESEEGEVENQTHDVESSQVLDFAHDFDRNDENNGAQMSVSSVDELAANVDGNIDEFAADFDGNIDEIAANVDGNIDELAANVDGNIDELAADFDGDVENNGSVGQGIAEGVSSETTDVEKLENLLSLLQSTVDESLETSLDDLELSLNEEVMVKVIETPLVPGDHLIRFFKWALSKEEFKVTTLKALGTLAGVICSTRKRKDAYALWDLVKDVGEDGDAVSVELLNQLISVFSELGKGKAAFEVFNKFEELGRVPNSDTYYLTTQALCKRSFYDWAALVSQKMLDAGILPDSERIGDIISFYCKGLRSKEAHAVYLAAKQKNNILPQRTVNFLVSCLSKEDELVPLAKEILADFSAEARKHAINPFSWVVRGLCRKKDIEGGKKLLLEMIEKGPPPGNAVFNTLINALSKAGDLEDAKEMVKLMESRGLKPDVFSYSVIISGYAKEGFMEDACKVLSDARKKHPKLCPATFHTLIRGYCKLEQFDKAVKLLSDMKKYGVEPNVDEYNKLIQSLCLKALDWKTAEKLLEEMKAKGMHLPGITRGLISAVKELEHEGFESEQAVAKA